MIWVILFLFINGHFSNIFLNIFIFFAVFLLELLQFINRIKFFKYLFCDVFCSLSPESKILFWIGTQISIKIIMFDPIPIPLSFLTSDFQKLTILLIPAIDKYLLLSTEDEELIYFEHMIFWLKTIWDDMCAQRNHFDAFELSACFPGDVVYSELKTLGTV